MGAELGLEMGVSSRVPPRHVPLCACRVGSWSLQGGGGCSFRFWAVVTVAAALGWADGSDGSSGGNWSPGGDRVGRGCPGVGGGAGAVAQ